MNDVEPHCLGKRHAAALAKLRIQSKGETSAVTVACKTPKAGKRPELERRLSAALVKEAIDEVEGKKHVRSMSSPAGFLSSSDSAIPHEFVTSFLTTPPPHGLASPIYTPLLSLGSPSGLELSEFRDEVDVLHKNKQTKRLLKRTPGT